MAARCSPLEGTDLTAEDSRYGFDSNLTEFDVTYKGRKQMLALLDIDQPHGEFPEDYEMQLVWPKPSWGKWQARDVEVISTKKISHVAGYCYGQRVMSTNFSISPWLLFWSW